MLPSGIDRSLLRAVQDQIDAREPLYTRIEPAFTGKVDPSSSSGALYADPAIGLPPGRIWVRTGLTEDIARSRAATAAICGVRNDYAGLAVNVGYDKGGYLVAFERRLDQESLSLYGGALPGMGVPQVPTDAQNQILKAELLNVALVHPSDAGGFLLTVNAYPGAYWQETLVDVSALSSPSSGTVALGIVAHDPADGGVYLYGATTTPFADTTMGISWTYFANIPLPYGVYPLAGVAVAASATEITNTSIAQRLASIVDLRLHIGRANIEPLGWTLSHDTTLPAGHDVTVVGVVNTSAYTLTVDGYLMVLG